MTNVLMKPSARKVRDQVFKVFHRLNLKDAVSYVAEVRGKCVDVKLNINHFSHTVLMVPMELMVLMEVCFLLQGERRGSLEFVRNETAIVDFKKKIGEDFTEVMPDIMADTSSDYDALTDMR